MAITLGLYTVHYSDLLLVIIYHKSCQAIIKCNYQCHDCSLYRIITTDTVNFRYLYYAVLDRVFLAVLHRAIVHTAIYNITNYIAGINTTLYNPDMRTNSGRDIQPLIGGYNLGQAGWHVS